MKEIYLPPWLRPSLFPKASVLCTSLENTLDVNPDGSIDLPPIPLS